MTKSTHFCSSTISLDGNGLSLESVEAVACGGARVELSSTAVDQLENSRRRVDQVLSNREIVYGITTGFGKFKDTFIDPHDSLLLQRNLIHSHAAGVGPAFDDATTRAVMLLRANALAKGFSGIRTEVVQLLLGMLNAGVHPIIPQQGSLGASGDLAPLAHLSLVLLGEGFAQYQSEVMSGADAMAKAGLEPIILQAKEGLALLNGTQVMSALGTLTVLSAERLCKIADIVAAMSLEAQLGSAKAFDQRIHDVRPHPGQIASASNLRRLLSGSELVESHAACAMVQDAYSLRCIPQVHGASRQAFRHAREILQIEINSATDNPLVFESAILSGGNFHGQPLALVLDYMSMAIAELCNISERRTERLVNPALSNGLPAFLTRHGGLNSGLMIAQYTAAALVSENKSLSHPASVDSIPTSANQEDHVSMGTIAGRKAAQILDNAYRVLSIELLCAAQGLDFRMGYHDRFISDAIEFTGGPSPGPGILAAHAFLRRHVTHLGTDRQLSPDFATTEALLKDGSFLSAVESAVGKLD